MLKVIKKEKGSYIIQKEEKLTGYSKNLALEQQIAYQCAPVLLDIKPANLLIIDNTDWEDVKKIFWKTDIEMEKLEMRKKKIMVFLYRREELQEYLFSSQIRYFLKQNGYLSKSLEGMIAYLKRKYMLYQTKNIEFPHEVGVFLGYPLDDVKGFMENKGKNYLLSGYWKVYNKEFHQDKLFHYYNEGRMLLWKLLKDGITLRQILENKKEWK